MYRLDSFPLVLSLSLSQVQEKLDKISSTAGSSPLSQGTPRSSIGAEQHFTSDTSVRTSHSNAKAEDMYQILCNDILLPLDMTLAAVRQFVWRQSAELTMYYRQRVTLSEENPVLVAKVL
jgi:WD repeat-containing protein 48